MTVTYRVATNADSRAAFDVFVDAVGDLGERIRHASMVEFADPAHRDAMWSRRRPLFEHLAATHERWWIAQDGDGRTIGHARSILRDGTRQLTEFFVSPHTQARGIGRELLERVFPPGEGAERRIVIATTDTRAVARYLRAGVYPVSSLQGFAGPPSADGHDLAGLTPSRVTDAEAGVEEMAAIDRDVLGHRRDAEHRYLLSERDGYLYRRGDRIVGYGYIGDRAGPLAMLTAADLVPALGHLEARAHERGLESVEFEVPLVNRVAIDHLLGRGFKVDPFVVYLMSDLDFVSYDRYVLTSPPFFL